MVQKLTGSKVFIGRATTGGKEKALRASAVEVKAVKKFFSQKKNRNGGGLIKSPQRRTDWKNFGRSTARARKQEWMRVEKRPSCGLKKDMS